MAASVQIPHWIKNEKKKQKQQQQQQQQQKTIGEPEAGNDFFVTQKNYNCLKMLSNKKKNDKGLFKTYFRTKL